MTFRNRSCVIGRGVEIFSICSAMALASKMPTQIGSTRWPSLSRRMTIGMLVMGSTIRPSMVISICMALQPRRRTHACQTSAYLIHPNGTAPHAVRSGTFDANRNRSADPLWRSGQIDDHIAARPSRQLRVAAPARGVDEHHDCLADQLTVQTALNLPLQPLESDDPPRLLRIGYVVR